MSIMSMRLIFNETLHCLSHLQTLKQYCEIFLKKDENIKNLLSN
jgi:hypothetical protein